MITSNKSFLSYPSSCWEPGTPPIFEASTEAYNAEPCDDQWLPTATQLTLATEATAWDAWKAKDTCHGIWVYG